MASKNGQQKAKALTLADLKLDPRNARKHNPRNVGMIVSAIHEVGAARSGVIDEDGVILAGNATAEALAEAGIERVKVIEADGNEWVVVQRKGLTPEQKRKLALYDNRTAELAEWDVEMLSKESEAIDLSALWSKDELNALLMNIQIPEDNKDIDEESMKETEHECPQCGFKW